MWTSRTNPLPGGLRVVVEHDSSPVSFAEVLRRWRDDEEFRAFFLALLADAPFSAYRWETPPITAATADRSFEFVLHDSPGLARTADPDAFAAYFSGSIRRSVVEFANLSGDAILVVPCPDGPD